MTPFVGPGSNRPVDPPGECRTPGYVAAAAPVTADGESPEGAPALGAGASFSLPPTPPPPSFHDPERPSVPRPMPMPPADPEFLVGVAAKAPPSLNLSLHRRGR